MIESEQKEFYLFSCYSFEHDLERIKQDMYYWGIPSFILSRVSEVIEKKRVVISNSWRRTFAMGMIGKNVVLYDAYVVMNIDGLNEAQKTAISSFWCGFLSGRDSKKRF